jgi:3-(3-hydroxy-phenyl)propionate hydroxylase
VKNHRRWEIALDEDDPPELYETPEAVWTLLARWLPPQDGELWRYAR